MADLTPSTPSTIHQHPPTDYTHAAPNPTAITTPTPAAAAADPGDPQQPQPHQQTASTTSASYPPTSPLPSPPHTPPPPSPSLREISSLASWTVSTYKPGCGVRELLSPSTASFWQSDGPQPHLLTIHFFKVVSVVRMRVYLDFELDESYTPTRMVFAAGMGEYDLVEFAEWRGDSPRGWVEVGLEGAGGREGRGYGGFNEEEDEMGIGEEGLEGFELEGGEEEMGPGWGGLEVEEEMGPPEDVGGGVLRCMCIQVRVMENHQNGKDTHVRGVQLFARDESVKRRRKVIPVEFGEKANGSRRSQANGGEGRMEEEDRMEAELAAGLMEADWMGEPEIR